MRRVLAQIYQADAGSPQFSRIARSLDVMNIQEFMRERLDRVLASFVTLGAPGAVVNGFDFDLPDGRLFNVSAGDAVDLAGRSFQTFPVGGSAEFPIPAPDVALPRIDLVYATLAADQEAENLLLPHRRLRTALEYEQGVPEYSPDNINVPTELRNTAVVGVRAGVPGAVPVAPAAGPNEVALYHVLSTPGDGALNGGMVTDVRRVVPSLWQLSATVAALSVNLNETIDDRVAALFVDSPSIVKAYDDGAGTFTLSVPAEYVQDVLGAILAAGPNTGIAVAYNDAGDTLVISGVAATGAVMGMMAAADKAKLDAATPAPTADALMRRDANGDVAARRLVSTMANGTSPMDVTSQTEVPNLNANFVQGQNLAALDARFINATGDDSMAGKLTGYNGLALSGFGLPPIVARYVNGNIAASIASTLLVAGAGEYLVLVMTYTTAANGSVAVSLHFTDPSANVYNPQVTNHGLAGGVMGQASMFTTTNAAGVNFSTAYVGPGSYGIRVIVLRFN